MAKESSSALSSWQGEAQEGADLLAQRMLELDHEWDIDRLIELEASLVILAGLVLSRKQPGFLGLSMGSASMLLLHALSGKHPGLSAFRRLGIRSQREIERERNSLGRNPDEGPQEEPIAGRAWPFHIAPNARRVEEHTPEPINQWIRRKTDRNIVEFSEKSKSEIEQRLKDLDREWDTERMLKVNYSIVVLAALTADLISGKKARRLAMMASGFMIQHALQGWCPPLAVLRRLGIRTIREIERERLAIG